VIKVLIVDDEPSVRLLCRLNLELHGMHVIEAADGVAAIEVARRELPDLILLDVMMPALDGWRVAAQLQEDERTRGIPFIFLTPHATYRDRVRGLNLGAVDYLTAPFNPRELASLIEIVRDRIERGERKQLKREKLAAARRLAEDERRAWSVSDWLVRHAAPLWLRLAEMSESAEELEALGEIEDEASARIALAKVEAVKSQLHHKESAARRAMILPRAWWGVRKNANRILLEEQRAATREAMSQSTMTERSEAGDAGGGNPTRLAVKREATAVGRIAAAYVAAEAIGHGIPPKEAIDEGLVRVPYGTDFDPMVALAVRAKNSAWKALAETVEHVRQSAADTL
jgi:DNA-binding response OmpR family regulator